MIGFGVPRVADKALDDWWQQQVRFLGGFKHQKWEFNMVHPTYDLLFASRTRYGRVSHITDNFSLDGKLQEIDHQLIGTRWYQYILR